MMIKIKEKKQSKVGMIQAVKTGLRKIITLKKKIAIKNTTCALLCL
jgi:hypothetical protein